MSVTSNAVLDGHSAAMKVLESCNLDLAVLDEI
jgi:hypothetical protein